jgi:hypothetical protein
MVGSSAFPCVHSHRFAVLLLGATPSGFGGREIMI